MSTRTNLSYYTVTRHHISPVVYSNWEDAIKAARNTRSKSSEPPVDELEVEPDMTSESDGSSSDDEDTDERDFVPEEDEEDEEDEEEERPHKSRKVPLFRPEPESPRDDRHGRPLNSNGKRSRSPYIYHSRSPQHSDVLTPPPPSQRRLHKRRRIGV